MTRIIHKQHFLKDDLRLGAFILIDKPFDWTSFDVVNKLRYAIRRSLNLKKYKLGHAGTLDPYATGLLVLGAGSYTKRIAEVQNATKTYQGTMVLGSTTPSYDAETEVDASFEVDHITPELLDTHRKQFIGSIDQVPPLYSAIKVDGVRAYHRARKGQQLSLEARTVEIYSFDISSYAPQTNLLQFSVCCSKGTYIRSLVNDFGKAMGSGAYLSALRRTQIGEYCVEDALRIEDFVKRCDESF